MDPYSLKKLNALRMNRQAAVHVTDLGDGRDRVIEESDVVAGLLGKAVLRAFRQGKAFTAEIDGRTFFLNPHLPPPRLLVIGAVHISQALAPMARLSGFDLHIIDPRTAFATPNRFPETRLTDDWPETVLAQEPLDPYTAVAALTHDPKIDDHALIAALKADCFYVGALGSRKTHEARVERLKQAGLSDKQIARIHAPIGLDIGAANPAEIAVATLAQIIEALRKRGLQVAGARAA